MSPKLWGAHAIQNARSAMEDAHAIVQLDERQTLYIVCDGHGGADVANEFVSSFPAAYMSTSGDTCVRLKAAIACADERLDKRITLDQGSTVVVCVVDEDYVYVAHAGDSRAILCRTGESATELTDDHNTKNESEVKRIRDMNGLVFYFEGGFRVMGMLATTRGVGDHGMRPYVSAEAETLKVRRQVNDELLIIATDGLWDKVSNEEACTIARRRIVLCQEQGVPAQEALSITASALTEAAVKSRSKDNVTVVVVDLKKKLGTT